MRKIALLSLCILIFAACSTSRKTRKNNEQMAGIEVVVKTPLKLSNCIDTKTHLRSVGSGTSADWNVARNIALTNCRGDMISKLNSFVKTAMENYGKQYASADIDNSIQRDFGQSFEQYAIVFSEGNLQGVTELEDVITRNSKTLEYTHWIALEINKDTVINETIKSFDRLPQEVKTTIDYNRDKFRNYIEEAF